MMPMIIDSSGIIHIEVDPLEVPYEDCCSLAIHLLQLNPPFMETLVEKNASTVNEVLEDTGGRFTDVEKDVVKNALKKKGDAFKLLAVKEIRNRPNTSKTKSEERKAFYHLSTQINSYVPDYKSLVRMVKHLQVDLSGFEFYRYYLRVLQQEKKNKKLLEEQEKQENRKKKKEKKKKVPVVAKFTQVGESSDGMVQVGESSDGMVEAPRHTLDGGESGVDGLLDTPRVESAALDTVDLNPNPPEVEEGMDTPRVESALDGHVDLNPNPPEAVTQLESSEVEEGMDTLKAQIKALEEKLKKEKMIVKDKDDKVNELARQVKNLKVADAKALEKHKGEQAEKDAVIWKLEQKITSQKAELEAFESFDSFDDKLKKMDGEFTAKQNEDLTIEVDYLKNQVGRLTGQKEVLKSKVKAVKVKELEGQVRDNELAFAVNKLHQERAALLAEAEEAIGFHKNRNVADMDTFQRFVAHLLSKINELEQEWSRLTEALRLEKMSTALFVQP